MRGLTALALLAVRAVAEAPLVAFGTHGLPFSGALTHSLSGADVDALFAGAVGLGDTHVFVVDEVSSLVLCVLYTVDVAATRRRLMLCSSPAMRSVRFLLTRPLLAP